MGTNGVAMQDSRYVRLGWHYYNGAIGKVIGCTLLGNVSGSATVCHSNGKDKLHVVTYGHNGIAASICLYGSYDGKVINMGIDSVSGSKSVASMGSSDRSAWVTLGGSSV